jgi:hypothetical protein
MKRLIIIALLCIIGITTYGQKVYNDGVIRKLSKTENGYEVTIGHNLFHDRDCEYFPSSVSIDVNEQGIVERIVCYDRHYFNTRTLGKTPREELLTYFEFNLGLKNLAENNLTTAVYHSKYYEYRISYDGVIVEIINKQNNHQ